MKAGSAGPWGSRRQGTADLEMREAGEKEYGDCGFPEMPILISVIPPVDPIPERDTPSHTHP